MIKGSIICVIIGVIVMPRFEGALPYVIHGSESRYIAATERLLSFLAINVVYQFICIKLRKNGGAWWIKLYCFGTGLYFIFLPYSPVASRLTVCFKALEMIMIPQLIKYKSRYRLLLVMYFFCSVWNNLLSQFICRSNAWRIDFPYASVFNTQAIYNYRVNAPL